MTENAYFFQYMRDLLGERYDSFLYAYRNKPRHKALRVNTLKISVEEFKSIFKGELKQNPLCSQSFYCDVKPSLDPLYHAGLYYMQEPSASAAVAAFTPFLGERVLDLCAAPGGKTTQAASNMTGGVIFANDIEYKRVGALKENIERLGIKNATVTCGNASDYRKAGFDGYFDTLIVDAPCSGGGMMRYEDVPYTEDIVSGCASRQKKILDDAAELLCNGGYMLYSTCTFAEKENEENVRYLLAKGFETVDVPLHAGVERGIGIPDARRIYPMNFDGEGHFYCVLKKTVGAERTDLPIEKTKHVRLKLGELALDAQERNNAPYIIDFDLPKLMPGSRQSSLSYNSVGVAVQKDGHSGKKSELSHALSHALDSSQVKLLGAVEIGERVGEYLSGEQIDISAPHGNVIVTYKGYALGLGYSAPSGDGTSVIKNRYPKALRIIKN